MKIAVAVLLVVQISFAWWWTHRRTGIEGGHTGIEEAHADRGPT